MAVIYRIIEQLLLKFAYKNPRGCTHNWVVYSTAIQEQCLELRCERCALLGSVDDPTPQEWERAYDAPENPYPWSDNSRVSEGTVRSIF